VLVRRIGDGGVVKIKMLQCCRINGFAVICAFIDDVVGYVNKNSQKPRF
jgi:hypothetical protein